MQALAGFLNRGLSLFLRCEQTRERQRAESHLSQANHRIAAVQHGERPFASAGKGYFHTSGCANWNKLAAVNPAISTTVHSAKAAREILTYSFNAPYRTS
jgi:hypothetical protein